MSRLHWGALTVVRECRYELSDSAIKDVEAYFGWFPKVLVARTSRAAFHRPRTGLAARHWRAPDINPLEGLQTWFEGAYEFGADGSTPADNHLSAFLLNAVPNTP